MTGTERVSETSAIVNRRGLDDPVYSNFDHELNHNIAERLEQEPDSYAMHAAWDFCAYVWHERSEWYEQVWRYGSPVETRHDSSLRDLIDSVNADYGSD